MKSFEYISKVLAHIYIKETSSVTVGNNTSMAKEDNLSENIKRERESTPL